MKQRAFFVCVFLKRTSSLAHSFHTEMYLLWKFDAYNIDISKNKGTVQVGKS